MIIEKDCDNEKFSSDINEVIRAVLNFFFRKIFCVHKKHKKHKNNTRQKRHKKHQKAQKSQKHNQAKAQNANK